MERVKIDVAHYLNLVATRLKADVRGLEEMSQSELARAA
jgi:hypothetical protein